MAIPKLVPGFRFSPTGVELVKYFLKRKVLGKKFHNDVITELDIYKYAPWDLPELSYLQNGDLEWYFFCPIEKKYRSGPRMKRATEIGFWKATGQDRAVQQNSQTVGMIKTLIFHTGKSPRGDRTDWVMHEYRLEDKDLADKGIVQDSYVICKVFQKEGPGPRNGVQYGRPFNEEDWSDDEVGIPFAESAALVPSLPVTSNNDQNLQTSGYIGSISMPCQSELVPPDPTNSCQTGLTPSLDPANPCQTGFMPYPDPVNSCQTGGFMPSPNPANSCQTGLTPSPDPSNSCQTMPYPGPLVNSCQTEFMPSPDLVRSCQIGLMPLPDPANYSYPDNQAVNNDDDDILAMLDIFKDNGVLPAPDPANDSYPDNQAVNNDDDDILAMLDIFEDGVLPEENIAEGALLTDFFDGLEDVDCSAELGSVGQNADFSTYGLTSTRNVVGHDDFHFMELIDLDSNTFWQTQPESWSRNK